MGFDEHHQKYPTTEQPAGQGETAKSRTARLTRGKVFVEGLGLSVCMATRAVRNGYVLAAALIAAVFAVPLVCACLMASAVRRAVMIRRASFLLAIGIFVGISILPIYAKAILKE